MSEHTKIICDGCKEDLRKLFAIDGAYLELEIHADGNRAEEMSRISGIYHFHNLTCLRKWEHSKKVREIE